MFRIQYNILACTAAYHPTPAAMAPPAPGAPGYPPGHAHGTAHTIHAYPSQCTPLNLLVLFHLLSIICYVLIAKQR
jgi:hypothetical protein